MALVGSCCVTASRTMTPSPSFLRYQRSMYLSRLKSIYRPVSGYACIDEAASPPNKRLKLPGGDRFKGSRVLCAGAHELSFNDTPGGGRVARSLRAVR